MGLTTKPAGIDTAFFKLLCGMIEPGPSKRLTTTDIAGNSLFLGSALKQPRARSSILTRARGTLPYSQINFLQRPSCFLNGRKRAGRINYAIPSTRIRPI
jgi:hypothetical protein